MKAALTRPARRMPGLVLALCAAAVILLAAAVGLSIGAAADPEKPVVKIIGTGGTIANTPSGRLSVEEVVAQLPEVWELAELRAEEVTRVGSSSLTLKELIDTPHAVNRTFAEEPDVDGAVVTVGSNTSKDLAYFLNLVVKRATSRWS